MKNATKESSNQAPPFGDAVARAHHRAGGGALPYEPTRELGVLISMLGLCESVLGADEPDAFDVAQVVEVLAEVQDRLRLARDIVGDVEIELDADDQKRAEIEAMDAARASQ
jgi:hypothetical protein